MAAKEATNFRKELIVEKIKALSSTISPKSWDMIMSIKEADPDTRYPSAQSFRLPASRQCAVHQIYTGQFSNTVFCFVFPQEPLDMRFVAAVHRPPPGQRFQSAFCYSLGFITCSRNIEYSTPHVSAPTTKPWAATRMWIR